MADDTEPIDDWGANLELGEKLISYLKNTAGIKTVGALRKLMGKADKAQKIKEGVRNLGATYIEEYLFEEWCTTEEENNMQGVVAAPAESKAEKDEKKIAHVKEASKTAAADVRAPTDASMKGARNQADNALIATKADADLKSNKESQDTAVSNGIDSQKSLETAVQYLANSISSGSGGAVELDLSSVLTWEADKLLKLVCYFIPENSIDGIFSDDDYFKDGKTTFLTVESRHQAFNKTSSVSNQEIVTSEDSKTKLMKAIETRGVTFAANGGASIGIFFSKTGSFRGSYSHEDSNQNTDTNTGAASNKLRKAFLVSWKEQTAAIVQLVFEGLEPSQTAIEDAMKVSDHETALDFLKKFGSHVPCGQQRLGGYSITETVIESSVALSDVELTSMYQQQNVNTGDVGLGVDCTGVQVSTAVGVGRAGNNGNAAVRNNRVSFGFSASIAGTRKSGLIDNSGHACVISRGDVNDYVPVWRVLEKLKNEDGSAMLAQCVELLREAWHSTLRTVAENVSAYSILTVDDLFMKHCTALIKRDGKEGGGFTSADATTVIESLRMAQGLKCGALDKVANQVTQMLTACKDLPMESKVAKLLAAYGLVQREVVFAKELIGYFRNDCKCTPINALEYTMRLIGFTGIFRVETLKSFAANKSNSEVLKCIVDGSIIADDICLQPTSRPRAVPAVAILQKDEEQLVGALATELGYDQEFDDLLTLYRYMVTFAPMLSRVALRLCRYINDAVGSVDIATVIVALNREVDGVSAKIKSGRVHETIQDQTLKTGTSSKEALLDPGRRSTEKATIATMAGMKDAASSNNHAALSLAPVPSEKPPRIGNKSEDIIAKEAAMDNFDPNVKKARGENPSNQTEATTSITFNALQTSWDAFKLSVQEDAVTLYLRGVNYSVAEDYANALIHFAKAADLGHPTAQFNLGACYYCGRVVDRDYVRAAYWYTKAAKNGLANAQNALGVCYKQGHGVPNDYKQAVAWFTEAANQGNATSQFNLGFCYDDGQGVTPDEAAAVYWYTKAAEQGHADASYGLGRCYYNGLPNDDGSLIATLSRIIYTNPFLSRRKRVPQDYAAAVSWFRQAADQGHAAAQFSLGKCYANGQGVTQDYTQAVSWYTEAADQGHVAAQSFLGGAQNSLGSCYARGEGVTKDYATAVSWYSKAAERGNYLAQYNLGNCYYEGVGVPQNHARAVFWYTKAADQGYANAQYSLGCRYQHGQGVPKDRVKAREWYSKAAAKGHKDAKVALKNMKIFTFF